MDNECIVLGIMSGTSLDGIDLALCRFIIQDRRWEYEILEAETVPYETSLKEKLSGSIWSNAAEFVELDTELGRVIGRECLKFISKTKIEPHYIASHGHTVFHQPQRGITTQIGNGAVIAALTGVTTICDFRSTDVALGGEGAPLVPVGDDLLFSSYDGCLNLGGFSNISFHAGGKRKAFDISPCNLPLNFLSGRLGYEFDCDGKTAASGKINEPLFMALNGLAFYATEPPRSLSAEWLHDCFLPVVDSFKLNTADLLCTVTEHIAFQIARELGLIEGIRILTTGGGAKNGYLIQRIRHLTSKEIIIPEERIVDYKEALVFAFLGCLRMRNEINCYSSVTGADRDSCSGTVYLG